MRTGNRSSAANSPSVLQRSPTISAVSFENDGPQRSAHELGHRCVRLAGDHRDAPGHRRDRRHDRAGPRRRAVRRREGRVVVGRDEACPVIGSRRWRPHPPVVEVEVQTDDHGVGRRPVVRATTAPRARPPRRPRPHRTPRPARPARPAAAAACALVTTSPSAGTPMSAKACSCSAIVDIELLVTNSTRAAGLAAAVRSPPAHRGSPSRAQPDDTVEVAQHESRSCR